MLSFSFIPPPHKSHVYFDLGFPDRVPHRDLEPSGLNVKIEGKYKAKGQ